MADPIATMSGFASQAALVRPRPWGVWATLGWTLLALAVTALAAFALVGALVRWDRSLSDYQFLFRNGDPIGSSMLIFCYLVLIASLAFAAKRSGWSAADYLALVRPRGHYMLFGLACVALPILVTFAHALEFDVRKLVAPHGFDRALMANSLAVHVIAVAVAAPVMEEIVFRGFLYRGLSESRLGVAGTIVLTSVVWALMHFDRNAAAIIDRALHGVAWGWLRWYTGSTATTIACHVANNGFAVVLILANLFGWFG